MRTRFSKRWLDELARKAESGDAEAAWFLADAYSSGEAFLPENRLAKVRRNPGKALRWARVAASLGLPEAMALLGTLLTDSGKPECIREGLAWLRRAYRKGCAVAAQNLAIVHSELGHPRRCVFWLRKSCLRGESADWFHLAVAHAAGYGVRRDLAEAGRLFGKVVASADAFPCDREAARQFLAMIEAGQPIRVTGSIGRISPEPAPKTRREPANPRK